MARSVVFRPAYWSYHENRDENTFDIHVSGLTEQEETVYAIVQNYRPHVLLELPARIAWTAANLKTLYSYLRGVLRPVALGKYGRSAQFYTHLAKVHYQEPAKFLQIELPTHSAGRRLHERCGRAWTIAGLGSFRPNEFAVHEHNIDPILKYTAVVRPPLPLAGWLEARETVREEDAGLDAELRKFSTAAVDLYCDWGDLKTAPESKTERASPRPTYLSFDIECNAENPNSKLPDPEVRANAAFQIACISGRVGCAPAERRTVLLTLYDPPDLDGVEVRRFGSERQLLLGFARHVAEVDPDLFLGYNILAFDWNFLLARAEKCDVARQFRMIGRVEGVPAAVRRTGWESDAYGEQNFAYIEAQGRLNVDLLVEIRREYSLPVYSLNAVAEKFLGQTKDDISARQLFMLYQLTRELGGAHGLAAQASPANLATIRATVKRIMVKRFSRTPAVRALRKALLRAPPEAVAGELRRALGLTGAYCVKDTLLPVLLFERLNLWEAMVASANCMCIPMSYLHTRGQQIRVLSQVYRDAIPRNLVVPFFPKGPAQKYQGAEVVEAVPGLYGKVFLLDFASLYPTIMIAFNICYTTILRDDDPTPDAECHVLEWEDHVGCAHDPKKRKRKKADVLCQARRYRFRRVRPRPDGTLEHEGVLPALARRLLTERAGLKKRLKAANARLAMDAGRATAEDRAAYAKKGWELVEPGALGAVERAALTIQAVVFDAQQKATKVSANSFYGSMGATGGFLPLLAGAESVTAMGRRLILDVIEYIRGHYDTVRLVYGDSVLPDTPLLVKTADGTIRTVRIDALGAVMAGEGRIAAWVPHRSGAKEVIEGVGGVSVWTENGFTPIKQVIRHRVANKRIVRVVTPAGVADVTEDHSLLDSGGAKVKPGDVKVGDGLLHCDLLPCPATSGTTVSETEAYAFGLYMHVRGADAVPPSILNAPTEAARKFFAGFGGDGADTFTANVAGKEMALGLWMVGQRLGYSATIDAVTQDGKGPGFRITFARAGAQAARAAPEAVTEKHVLYDAYDGYVYDLETANHHFHVGPGRLVVHNTDSCLFTVQNATLSEAFDLAHESAKRATHHVKTQILGLPSDYTVVDRASGARLQLDAFEHGSASLSEADARVKLEYDASPIELEFEDMFKDYLLLTKKRYAGRVVNREGQVAQSLVKKGIVLARRDNCALLKNLYKKLVEAVLDRRSEAEVHRLLYAGIDELFTRRVRPAQLVITLSVKSLLTYAKRAPGTKDTFLDADGDVIPGEIEDPLDPRLVYPNLRNAQLALRMLRRGTKVQPGTRLEFVYVKNDGARHEGDRIEEYEHFCEYREDECLEIDFCHYVDKQLRAPVTELLNVAFPRERVPYVAFKAELEQGFAALAGYQKDRVDARRGFEAKVAYVAKSARRYAYCARALPCSVDPSQLCECPFDAHEAPCAAGLAGCRCVEHYGGAGPNDIHGRDAALGELCAKYQAFTLVNKLRKRAGLRPIQERKNRKKTPETHYLRDDHVVADILAARRAYAEVVKTLNIKFLDDMFG